MKVFPDIGVGVPEVLLPRPGVDLGKWAVVACDQFTSEPEYWTQLEGLVGKDPSTLRMVFPEIYLEEPGKAERIKAIQRTMDEYLGAGVLSPREGMLLVERMAGGRKRTGLILCLDLECYDYSEGSTSLIRATEGTIVDRLPPRMSIREGAAVELPHILVLIDDPDRTVIEPVAASASSAEPLYDFDLNLGGGHLKGFSVSQALQDGVVRALRSLAEPRTFSKKYGLKSDAAVLLFAMGDGNHSLATAKAVWEKLKPSVGPDHPARYALVELENVHDAGLEFEPIHRVLFGLKPDGLTQLVASLGNGAVLTGVRDQASMRDQVLKSAGKEQLVGVITSSGLSVLHIPDPSTNLAVGTLQHSIDVLMKSGGAQKLDYLHGEDVVFKLGKEAGNAGFFLPPMQKSALFKTVILDGALPRKTFSMGEAREKRYYMEARKIR